MLQNSNAASKDWAWREQLHFISFWKNLCHLNYLMNKFPHKNKIKYSSDFTQCQTHKSAKNNFEIYWLKNIVMLVFGYDTLLSHSFVDSTYLAHTKALEFSKVIEKSSYRAQPIVLHIGPTQMKGIGMAVDAQAMLWPAFIQGKKELSIPSFLFF